jgi:hypothetical protein
MFGRGHRFQLGQAVARAVVRRLFSKTRGAFLEGFKQDLPRSQVKNPEEVADEIAQLTRIAMEHHARHVELATIISETRDKLIDARKELSRVKRAASTATLPTTSKRGITYHNTSNAKGHRASAWHEANG